MNWYFLFTVFLSLLATLAVILVFDILKQHKELSKSAEKLPPKGCSCCKGRVDKAL
jgi:lipopolysaccharide export LptBFGC system permease protein LptF